MPQDFAGDSYKTWWSGCRGCWRSRWYYRAAWRPAAHSDPAGTSPERHYTAL